MAKRINQGELQAAVDAVLAALQRPGDRREVDLGTPGLLDRLQKELVDPGKRPPAPRRVWDTKIPELCLRVLTTGRMSFNVQWSRRGATSLGRYPGLTVESARTQARAALVSAHESPDRVPTIARAKPAADTLTLEGFVGSEYRAHLRAKLKSRAHADTEEARLLRVLHKFKRRPLSALTHHALQRVINQRAVSAATRARDRNTIRAALMMAVKWGFLESNPAIGLEIAKAEEGVTRYLSPDEERALIAGLESRDQEMREARERTLAAGRKQHAKLRPIPSDSYPDHLTPLVLVALHTGCRRGELFGLRWREVDLKGRHPQLTVRGTGSKSGKTRHIPLNATAVDVLTRWRRHTPDTDRVFGLVDVKKAWAGVLASAEVQDFRFHDLRHTFASKLVQKGAPLNTVRDLLGHADIKMTLRYAHLAPENKAAAVALLDSPAAGADVIPFPAKAG